ncbi:MAG: trehalose monomycolate/heme transporter, partial [Mycobacterium sp.]|nr:trehalose monomycolate/heme transporter [Mycobacterium sp.]
PRPPHDPTHPAAEGASRPGATTRMASPQRTNTPSGAGTTRIPTPNGPADEPATTRISIAKNAVRNVVNNAAAATRQAAKPPPPPPRPQPPREDREIESWLGELRGTGAPARPPTPPPAKRPSADATRAMPEQRPRPPRPSAGNEPTTAIPTQRPRRPQSPDATTAIPTPAQKDPEATQKIDTEKINTREEDEPKRRGGGVSAQDLLRREGRL